MKLKSSYGLKMVKMQDNFVKHAFCKKNNFGKHSFFIIFFYKLWIRIQGFDDQQFKKEIQLENFVIFFDQKIAV